MRNDDRREREKRGFAPRQGGKNPPRPARRTYDIPPAERADGPFAALPVREGGPRACGGDARSPRRPRADAHAARAAFHRAPAAHGTPAARASCAEMRPAAGEPAGGAQPHPRGAQKWRAAGKAVGGRGRPLRRGARHRAHGAGGGRGGAVCGALPAGSDLSRPIRGLLAFRSARAYATIEDILARAKERGEAPLVVVLDQVTDPTQPWARSSAAASARGRTGSSSPNGAPRG